MEKMKWLNEQEERCTMLLNENQRRKKFLEDELSTIRSLKQMVQSGEELKRDEK